MTKKNTGVPFVILELLIELEKRLRDHWADIFLPEDEDPSFDEASLAISDYVQDDRENRIRLHEALTNSLNEDELSEDLPDRIFRIASCKPQDYKINAVEIEIRLSLLLAISSIDGAKKAIGRKNEKSGIAWFGHAKFWEGVHVAAYSAQQRDWCKLDKAVAKKLANDPKQAVKQQVRECWNDWKNGLRSYKSKSAFARDMLDKFPTQKDEKGRQTGLESQRVIERWCKEWESELS